MDHHLVVRCQHMPRLFYPHPLLHEGAFKLLETTIHYTPAYRAPAHHPHVRERCCMLCPHIPSPHIRQAGYGGYIRIHPCDLADFGGVGICGELHVG